MTCKTETDIRTTSVLECKIEHLVHSNSSFLESFEHDQFGSDSLYDGLTKGVYTRGRITNLK